MDTLGFLAKLLPAGCFYFLDTPAAGRGFKHHSFDDIATMAARALDLSSQGATVYFACSGYREKSIEREITTEKGRETKTVYRVQANVKLVRSFWLDLDVGASEPGKPAKYPDQRSALGALSGFLAAAKLPRPLLVSSGYGIHAYWPLIEPLLPGQWKKAASHLRSVTRALGLSVDHSRTCDEASVLRPIGTLNRKTADARPVALLIDAEANPTAPFVKLLEDRARELAPDETRRSDAVKPANPETLIVPSGFEASSAKVIANRCNQIRIVRDKGGDVSEPLWYAAIQLLDKTTEGESIAHEWSRPYPGYSFDETQRKLLQIKAFGPTTCATFSERNPDGCKDCPYRGKIASPIQLGVEIREAPPPTVLQVVAEDRSEEIVLPNPPAPFKRGDAAHPGLFVEVEPGVPIRFYPYDMFPTEIAYDDQEKHIVTRVRHHLPLDGWGEFTFRSSNINSPKDFSTAMIDQGVFPENAKWMAMYMDSYLKKLQTTMKTRQLHNSMGWKDDNTKFLLGRNLYSPGERIEPVGLARRVNATAVNAVRTAGTLEAWKEGIAIFDRPGLEHYLFAFLTGFGSPLLTFTGYDGCMVSMVGTTGTGKTITGIAAASVYGNYMELRMRLSDTELAKVERMNSLANLPVIVDEITNIDPRTASEWIYLVTQGQGREKLYRDSTTREAPKWASLTFVSSNKSIAGILSVTKQDIEAEMMRVLEIGTVKVEALATEMSRTEELVTTNYGHAGRLYARFLVENSAGLRQAVDNTEALIRRTVKAEGRERFWVATIAANLTGYLIAWKLGLLPFKQPEETFQRLMKWVEYQFALMRTGASDAAVDYVSVIGEFLNEYLPATLVVEEVDGTKGRIPPVISRAPSRELVVRVEKLTGLIWVDQRTFHLFLDKRQINRRTLKEFATQLGILRMTGEKKMLGAGLMSSPQVRTWVFNERSPNWTRVAAPEVE